MSIEASAADLYARVRACTRCNLARTRTLAVPGEGPLNAEVMFIGEAPGANEDKQGRPFVGAAGNFLGELLAAAGLTREAVYICNVLKCRPPANRDPLADEIDACRDYLDEQIDLIDPLVVVTLGRYSMAKFFPNQVISKIHGEARETAGCFYVPMYHPAAALHQGNLRQVMIEDFRALPALLERARMTRGRVAATPTLAPIAEQPTLESTTYTLADAAGEPASPRTAEATSEPQQRTSAQAGAPQEPATPIQIKLFD